MSKGVQYVLEVLDYATPAFERLFGNVGRASRAIDSLSNDAENNMQGVGRSIENVAANIAETFETATSDAAGSFENAANNIIADANRIDANVGGIPDRTIDVTATDGVTQVAQEIETNVAAVEDRIVDIAATDNTTSISAKIKNGLSSIKDKLVNFNARDTITNVSAKIKNGLSSIKDKLVNLSARDAATNVINKIKSGLAGLRDRHITVRTQQTGSPFAGMMPSAKGLLSMVGGPLVAGGIGLGAMLGGAISQGMENDLQKTNITTLLRGDVAAAGKLFGELSTYSIKTPYEKADIIEGQKTMMSFGLSTEFAFGKLKNIGDIAMGDAQKMKSLTLAFSQATSAGKLQGQDLLQMINAGFNPLQVISERTGESMASLKKRMEDGGISATELAGAFEMATDKQGLFYQGAEKASSTFAGKVSNLKDAFSEGLIAIYEELKPVLMPLLDQLITGVGKMTAIVVGGLSRVRNALGWVWQKFQEGNPLVLALTAIVAGFAIQMAVSKVVTLAITAATTLWTGAQWLLNAAMTANPIGLVIAGIVALIALIGYVIYRYEGWGTAWDNLVSWLDSSWQLFKQSFITTWLQTENFFLVGIERLKTAWFSFKSLWDEDGAAAGMAKITADQGNRMQAITDSKAAEAGFEKKANAAFAGIKLTDTGKGFKDALNAVKSKVGISAGVGGAAAEISKQNSKKNAGGDLKDIKGAAGAGAGKAKGINEGGNRPTNITITIHKLQDSLVVNTNGGSREGGKQAGTDVVNELLMALNSIDQKGGSSND